MELPRIIAIAYGNPLRGDDELAWRAADELKKKFRDIEIVKEHQLVPELAESISRSEAVIFIDAAADEPGQDQAGKIRIVEMSEAEPGRDLSSPFHHQYSPVSLLALAAKLYGARPRAFVASLVGQDFGHGEHLSPAVENAMPEFLARIEKLILELKGSGPKSHGKP
jgi:hydrogenase maturation protease